MKKFFAILFIQNPILAEIPVSIVNQLELKFVSIHSSSFMQSSTSFHKFWFSIAAAIRSRSLICLLISSSVLCAPFLMKMSTLRLFGKWRRILMRIVSPIRVAKEQWGTVGLNSIRTTGTWPSVGFCTKIASSDTTFRSCSRVNQEKISTISYLIFQQWLPRVSRASPGLWSFWASHKLLL